LVAMTIAARARGPAVAPGPETRRDLQVSR